MAIIFRRVRTDDKTVVLLNWIAIDGGVRQWNFTADNLDTSTVKADSIDNINSFRGIPKSIKRDIALTTFSLTLSEFNYLRDIQFSNLVTAELEEGELKISIKSSKIGEINSMNLRDFSIKILVQDMQLMVN